MPGAVGEVETVAPQHEHEHDDHHVLGRKTRLEIRNIFGCNSSPRSPNVSLSVCLSVTLATVLYCIKAINFKVFRLKDF